MAHLSTLDKLAILADAAKYDASCASSGAEKRNSSGTQGIGSTEGMGICHSYAPDGRCISLLKVLLTNYCQYDCLYCVNRVSSNVRRARFGAESRNHVHRSRGEARLGKQPGETERGEEKGLARA